MSNLTYADKNEYKVIKKEIASHIIKGDVYKARDTLKDYDFYLRTKQWNYLKTQVYKAIEQKEQQRLTENLKKFYLWILEG